MNQTSTSLQILLPALALSLVTQPLLAAPYAAGDLLMGFVATSAPGESETLLVRLGTAGSYRDASDAGTNSLNFLNIGSRLATQFGSVETPWYERSDLYVCLFSTTSTSNTSSSVNAVKDPARTLYASQSRIGVGTLGTANSSGFPTFGDGAMTDAAVRMSTTASRYASATDLGAGVVIIPDSQSNTLDEFTRPAVAASFNNFNGGIEQILAPNAWGTYGAAGSVEAALDFYRLQARNDIATQYGSGLPTGTAVFKGTFTLNQSGQVSFIAATATTPADGFNTWAVSKGLPSGVATSDDRDNDGIPALMEYGLDLNPLAFSSLPSPTVSPAGITLSFAKGSSAAADPKITYVIEASSALTGGSWTTLTTITNNASTISALLPADDPSGRRFARLKVTKSI